MTILKNVSQSTSGRLTIEQSDCLNADQIQVTLSDGRVLVLTLDQLLKSGPRVLLRQIEEDAR